MEPDYSKYSKVELIDALNNIDEDKWPDRTQKLKDLIAEKGIDIEPTEAPQHNGEGYRFFIFYYIEISTIFVCFLGLFYAESMGLKAVYLVIGILVAIGLYYQIKNEEHT